MNNILYAIFLACFLSNVAYAAGSKRPGGPIKLTLTLTPNNNGSILCDNAVCQTSYNKDTVITLSAQANTGFSFSGWSGSCSGNTANCTITMSAEATVTANFSKNTPDPDPITFTLNTNVIPNDSGSISCTKGNQKAVCSAEHDAPITLTATPETGFTFGSWTGCTSSSNICTVDAEATVTANFLKNTPDPDPITFTLQTSVNPNAAAGDIRCGKNNRPAVCDGSHNKGDVITLSALGANSNSRVESWGGACAGIQDNVCELTMDADKTASVTFSSENTPPPTDPELPALTGTAAVSSTGVSAAVPNSTFSGGISIDGQNFSKDAPSSVVKNDAITVKGMIKPDASHVGLVADIFAVAYFVAEGFFEPTESYKDSCDYKKVKGKHFYQLISAEKARNNSTDTNATTPWYSEWTDYNQREPSRRSFGEWDIEVAKWDGALPALKPFLTGETLTADYELSILDKTKINAAGRLCFTFGYRLQNDDGTLIFNAESINVTFLP